MASAEFRGYCNRPESKDSSKGGYSKFTLGVTQKNRAFGDKPESKYQYYVDCVDFKNAAPPPDGAFITVSGYLDLNEYVSKSGKNAGKTMIGLKLNVQALEVAPPRAGTFPAAEPTGPDPFADAIPF